MRKVTPSSNTAVAGLPANVPLPANTSLPQLMDRSPAQLMAMCVLNLDHNRRLLEGIVSSLNQLVEVMCSGRKK